MVGKLKEVPVREVWRHEAHDFTTWLEENIEILNELLNLEITSADREQAAGNFHVDLLCEDEDGKYIVIENQLERSNHDHLGKLITYLSSFEAKAAIWIVTEPRPEHVKAIIWLNESTNASFYLLKLTAVQIDDSQPAPLMTLIAGPSEEARQVAVAKKDHSLKNGERQEFWTELLEAIKLKSDLFSGKSAGIGKYYLQHRAGLPTGLRYNFIIADHTSRAELYIDRKRDREKNSEIFEMLYANQKQIQESCKYPIEWEPLEDRFVSKISINAEAGLQDKENWPSLQTELVDKMVELDKALKPFYKNI